MNRIDAAFTVLGASSQKAFVAYVCAGDPDLATTVEIVRILESCGVDIIELGLPFSDPLADGIVNQMAAGRALASGTTTAGVLSMIRQIREFSQIPLVLFTYLNPVYVYGFEKFHADAAAAGADGVLLLDLPADEQVRNAELPRQQNLRRIGLIAPTTPAARAREIAEAAEGFIYYISREGVTGAQVALAENLSEQSAAIVAVSKVPVCVGFGISTPDQAAAVTAVADGVVVGSAIVKVIAEHGREAALAEKLRAFVRPLVAAAKGLPA